MEVTQAEHAINIEGVFGGVYAYEEKGVKGTVIVMPHMDPVAFIHKFSKGSEQEYAYITEGGVRRLAEVLPKGETNV